MEVKFETDTHFTEIVSSAVGKLGFICRLPEFLIHGLNVFFEFLLHLRSFRFECGSEETFFHCPWIDAQLEILDEFE